MKIMDYNLKKYFKEKKKSNTNKNIDYIMQLKKLNDRLETEINKKEELNGREREARKEI